MGSKSAENYPSGQIGPRRTALTRTVSLSVCWIRFASMWRPGWPRQFRPRHRPARARRSVGRPNPRLRPRPRSPRPLSPRLPLSTSCSARLPPVSVPQRGAGSYIANRPLSPAISSLVPFFPLARGLLVSFFLRPRPPAAPSRGRLRTSRQPPAPLSRPLRRHGRPLRFLGRPCALAAAPSASAGSSAPLSRPSAPAGQAPGAVAPLHTGGLPYTPTTGAAMPRGRTLSPASPPPTSPSAAVAPRPPRCRVLYVGPP